MANIKIAKLSRVTLAGVVLFIMAGLMLSVTQARAETASSPEQRRKQSKNYSYKLEVFGNLGWGGYLSDESFQGSGVNFGGGIAYFPLSRLGIGFEVDGGKHSRSFGGSGVQFEGTTLYVSGNVIYKFSESRTQFYVLGGGGILHNRETNRYPGYPPDDFQPGYPPEVYESKGNSFAINAGVGTKIFLSSKMSLRPEFRIVLGPGLTGPYGGSTGVKSYYRGSIGVGFHR